MEVAQKQYRSAKIALSEGENFLAYDLAAAIPDTPSGPSAQKLWIMALALARSGSIQRATELANSLPDVEDIDIMGFKSRIYKDLALAERDLTRKRELFLKAARRSATIFKKKRSWYNGINAASCLRMAGNVNESRDFVIRQVLPLCEAAPQKDMWLEATLGECHLLLSNFNEAAQHYSMASEMALSSGSFGDFSSTLRQLQMLLTTFASNAADLWSRIDLPAICVFSGHRIDQPGVAVPRFPPSAEIIVRNQIKAAIKHHKIALGYASCANGGDILFLESVLSAGGHVWVAPPFPIEASIRMSVACATGDWEKRLQTILTNPNTTVIDPECDVTGENDEIAYDFTNRYILGLARLKSKELHLPVRGLAVWDGITSESNGNVSSAVKMWTESNINYDTIKLEVPE